VRRERAREITQFSQVDDPCVRAMENTDEGKKVTRQGGMKYIAVFRRLPNASLC